MQCLEYSLHLLGPPNYCFLQSAGANEDLFFLRGRGSYPDPHRVPLHSEARRLAYWDHWSRMAGGLQASEQLLEEVNESLRPDELNQSMCKLTTGYLLAPSSSDVSVQGLTNIQLRC